jgi:hypothetical protein
MTTPNHPDTGWLCAGCNKVVLERDAVFRIFKCLPPRGEYRTALHRECASKERSES